MSNIENASSTIHSRALYPILLVNFIGSLGFSIVLPFLIFLVTDLGGNAFIYGVLGATYSFFQLLGAPLLGRWSDRIGRRKVLLVSQLGTLLSWALFLVALFLPMASLFAADVQWLGAFTITLPLLVLFFARALDGITGGNISVANAYLADITTDAERSASFGKMAVSANFGFILGPAIASLLGGMGWGATAPVLAALLISLVASAFIFFKLPESNPCALSADPEHPNVRHLLGPDLKPCYEAELTQRLSTRAIFQLPGVGLLLVIYFLVFLAFNVFYVAFPVYAVEGLAWSLTDTGLFFSVLAIALAVVQGPVLGWAAKRWSESVLIVAGSLLLGGSFLLFTLSLTWTIYTSAVLLALGNGLMWPSVQALLSKAAGPQAQGAVQGLAGSLGASASILGLLLGGFLFGLFGASVFIVSAVLVGLVCLLASFRLNVRR